MLGGVDDEGSRLALFVVCFESVKGFKAILGCLFFALFFLGGVHAWYALSLFNEEWNTNHCLID